MEERISRCSYTQSISSFAALPVCVQKGRWHFSSHFPKRAVGKPREHVCVWIMAAPEAVGHGGIAGACVSVSVSVYLYLCVCLFLSVCVYLLFFLPPLTPPLLSLSPEPHGAETAHVCCARAEGCGCIGIRARAAVSGAGGPGGAVRSRPARQSAAQTRKANHNFNHHTG